MTSLLNGMPVIICLRGSLLKIGAVKAGNYGYLHTGGGLDVPLQLGARSTHLGAGIGAPTAGDQIAIGEIIGLSSQANATD